MYSDDVSSEAASTRRDLSKETHPRVNVPLLVLIVLLGAGVVALGVVGSLIWSWAQIWSTLLLETGTTVALGGLLLVVERALVRHVRSETQASEQRMEDRAAELERRIETRLADISKRTREETEARHESQDAAVQALSENLTRENVLAAMSKAGALDALASPFRVRASHVRDGMRLEFHTYSTETAFGETSDSLFMLFLWLPGSDPPGSSFGSSSSDRMVIWEEGQSAAEVADRLIELLERNNKYGPDTSFDPQIAFTELQRSLDVALRLKRGQLGPARLKGRLIEAVDENWFLTTYGLENPHLGLFFEANQFHSSGSEDVTAFPTDAPAHVPQSEWEFLTSLAIHTFPQS